MRKLGVCCFIKSKNTKRPLSSAAVGPRTEFQCSTKTHSIRTKTERTERKTDSWHSSNDDMTQDTELCNKRTEFRVADQAPEMPTQLQSCRPNSRDADTTPATVVCAGADDDNVDSPLSTPEVEGDNKGRLGFGFSSAGALGLFLSSNFRGGK